MAIRPWFFVIGLALPLALIVIGFALTTAAAPLFAIAGSLHRGRRCRLEIHPGHTRGLQSGFRARRTRRCAGRAMPDRRSSRAGRYREQIERSGRTCHEHTDGNPGVGNLHVRSRCRNDAARGADRAADRAPETDARSRLRQRSALSQKVRRGGRQSGRLQGAVRHRPLSVHAEDRPARQLSVRHVRRAARAASCAFTPRRERPASRPWSAIPRATSIPGRT